MSFHVSAQSVRAVAGGLVAAATLLPGLALAPTAMAADSATADNAPSVAGHAYNELTPRTIFRRTTTLRMRPR